MGSSAGKFESIQALRCIAVLAVVLSHSFHELARMFAGVNANFNEKAFPGDFGVDLFFVISGFIMVHVSRNAFAAPGAVGAFVKRRLIRIVPLYWLMTSLMIAIVMLAPEHVHTATSDARQWIASYLFIPYPRISDGLMRPVLGLGWSLNYEMYFYALFSVCLLLPMRRAVPLAVALLFGTWLLGFTPLARIAAIDFLSHPMIFEFAAGMLLGWSFCAGARLAGPACLALIAAGFALLFLAPAFDANVEAGRHLFYGIPALLITAGAGLYRKGTRLKVNPLAVTIGDASYSAYLSHPFVLGAMAVVVAKFALMEALPPAVLCAAFLAVALIASAATGILLHRFVDLPLTGFLHSRLGKTRAISAASARPVAPGPAERG